MVFFMHLNGEGGDFCLWDLGIVVFWCVIMGFFAMKGCIFCDCCFFHDDDFLGYL